MADDEVNQRLSLIQTRWSLVMQAHLSRSQSDAVLEAQRVLLERYGGAVYRYLLGATRNPDVADDLAQEFAVRFLRGDFRRAAPECGRFRDFLKAAVRNLIVDYHRRQNVRRPAAAVEDVDPATNEPDIGADLDRQFLASWQQELLGRTWEGLEREQKGSGQPLFTVLRMRVDHADLRSAQLAEKLSAQLGKPVNDVWVRQMVFRARQRFADLLLDDVTRSLDRPSAEELHQELIDLGLLEYCRPALERRGQV